MPGAGAAPGDSGMPGDGGGSGAGGVSGPGGVSGAGEAPGDGGMPDGGGASARVAQSHRARGMAESFGVDAARYDRTRPRYPAELVDRIVAAAPGPDVLDVGTGTGIVARQLAAAGCRVLGVEVDARMAAFARAHGTDVEVARFEEWDPAGRAFDAVVAGQTWHWIDPIAGAAQAGRALRPGGLLAAFWNAGDPPPALAEAFAAVNRRVLPEATMLHRAAPAAGYGALVDKAADGLRQAGGFDEPARWQLTWEQPYTRDEWLDLLPTQGGYTRLPPDRLAELLAGVGAAIDESGGAFVVRYTTVALAAARRDATPTSPDPAAA